MFLFKVFHCSVDRPRLKTSSSYYCEKHEEAGFNKIQNTEYSRSFIEKQFDFGSVNVSSAGSSGKELRFRAVQDPKGVQQLINRLSKDQNEKSDHKEDSVSMGQKEMVEEIRKTRENLEQITDYLEDKK